MNAASAGELLGPAGPFARRLPGFKARAVQSRMAEAVEAALAQRAPLVVEAGTGTGKTFAYLVPALRSGLRVVVSTGTKNLQDQLFFRDLPRVREILAATGRASLLKGRANYLCLYRLHKAQRDARHHPRAQQLEAVAEWAHRTESGELAELGACGPDDALRPWITSTADNCLGSQCPDFAACHVVKARRAAAAADLVVVNHHLLLADFRLKEEGYGVLPGADAVIVDEAHQLPELALQFFGERLSTHQLAELARDVAGELEEFRDLPQIGVAVENLAAAAARLEPLLTQVSGRMAYAEFCARPGVTPAIETLRAALALCARELRGAAQRSAGLANCATRAEAFASSLEQLCPSADAADPESVRWVEASGRGGSLLCAPLEPAEGFRRLRLAYPGAWIFTSATLAAGDDFSHFCRALGLDEVATLKLDSPYDYARQARLYLPPALPDPNAPEYPEAVAETLLPLIAASGGGAFVLCTSHRALGRIALRLRSTGLPLLVQGEDDKARLVDRFARAGNAVLVGTASFWEGVDVKGPALRLVAIDRLPFGQQNDPVLEARLAAIHARGGNPFFELQLPRAITLLRQGIGRLLRDESDRGLVVVCDPRLRGKSYGRRVLASLPPLPILDEPAAALEWLKTVSAAA
jgi:ATP-dependent DNA helicase DinG